MVSFKDGQFVLFDSMLSEPIQCVADLLAAFGDPAARLDWHFGTLKVPGGELAYSDRGIALFVNTEADRILHLALFQPTSLEGYVRGLRPHLRKEPRAMKA